MYLAEIKVEMENIEKKVDQICDHIGRISGSDPEGIDAAINQLFDLYDKYRSNKLVYARYCNGIKLDIGGGEVTLAEAKIILETMQNKVNVLDDLIKVNVVMDTLSLIDDREKLNKEYTSLNNALQSIEWSTKID